MQQTKVIWNKITVVAMMLLVVKKGIVNIYPWKLFKTFVEILGSNNLTNNNNLTNSQGPGLHPFAKDSVVSCQRSSAG